MPPRLEYSDNVVFLFKCIESTGVKIDFTKAGSALGINSSAARMRYVRLRKAVEGGLNAQSSGTVLSTPPRSVSKKNKATNAPSANRKSEKRTKDDVAVKLNQEETETGKIQRVVDDEFTKRDTRGVKIDFTPMLSSDEALDGSEADNEFSDSQSSSFVIAPNKRQVKTRTPALSATTGLQTPPAKKNVIKQVSASPEGRQNSRSNKDAMQITPPESGKKRAAKTFVEMDGNLDEDVQGQLFALESGHEVSESMFKRRKVSASDSAAPQSTNVCGVPTTPPSGITRTQKMDTNRLMHGGMQESNMNVIDDSVSPDDSISVVKGAEIEDTMSKRQGAEKSLLERITRFWQ